MSFTDAGKFTYKCAIYTTMKGSIEVLEQDDFSSANRRKSFQTMVNQLDYNGLLMRPPATPFDYSKQRSRNQEQVPQQASQEELRQRLVEVLEEEKIDSDRDRHRSISPADAFQDAFTQYGMKLGPELMRLSMESAHEDSDYNDEGDKSSNGNQTDGEREENDFLAEQRQTSKKSNPNSG